MRAARGFISLASGLAFALIGAAHAAERDPYEAVIEAARRAVPAVVALHAFSPPGSPAASVLGQFRKGTGMIIDPSGLILTSNHVVMGAQRVFATLTDGRRLPGEVLRNDAQTDLALLRVRGEGLPALPLGRSAGLRLGQGVIVVGSAQGKDREVTLGTVNAIGRFVGYWEFMLNRALHTDALVRLGYSGGPLLNLQGEVVGVVSFLRPTVLGPAGVVIPIEEAYPLREEVLSPGGASRRARRSWLGTIAYPLANRVVIQGLTPGGPAMRANVHPKDLITHVNAVPINGLEAYYREIWKHPPGTEIQLTIQREGQTLLVPIRSADRDRFFARPTP
ncbi:MAG: S1C family serine protease [Nitrospinota bacterium]